MKKTARTQMIEARKRRQWSQQEVADLLGTTRPNVSRWEAGLTTPGPYFRAKLCALFGKQAQELGLLDEGSLPPSPAETPASAAVNTNVSSTDEPALWNIPSSRNPRFTGRDDLLTWLHQQFFPASHDDPTLPRRVALTQAQAIKGLGGIGKTQIAIEYAYRSREQGRFTHIVWINAASEEAIVRSFVTLAETFPVLTTKSETNPQRIVKAIKRWLEQSPQRWLLIFDNADEIAILQPYLPQQGNGNVLITTRAHAVGSLATSIDVENMGLVEGTAFLLHRAQRQHLHDEEQNEATNIVIALDGFPLALDQAGAYIEETRCSFRDYLQMYQEHHQALLARRGIQITNYPDSVATTWSLSFQKIAQENPTANELLRLCAFLAPDAIPEELLTRGAAHWPPTLQQAAVDRLAFNHLLEDLLRFSLIKRRVDDHVLSIHRLVQVVQKDRMTPEEQRQWAEYVIRAVHTVFPPDPKEDTTSWPQCLRYLEQVQACDKLIQQHLLLFPEAAELLDRAGVYLSEQAFYTLAEPLYQRALQIWEQLLGAQHLQISYPLHHLAYLFLRQGQYEQAESAYQRALLIREQQLGPEHAEVAYLLNGLGNLYFDQGKYKQAESLYQRALVIREQQLGPEHPLLTFPLNGLADLYRVQDKYAEAEPLFLRALHIREQQIGADHPDLAHPLNNLAILYREQGRYAEAEPLYLHALHIWEQQLGTDHPQVVYPLNGLATLYAEQGMLAQAEPLFLRALHIREQQLEPDHPHTAESLNNLAILYRELGRYAEAEPLSLRALGIWEKQFGLNHIKVAHPLLNLAEMYREQGKYAEAETLFRRALSIWEQRLGSDHSDVAFPLHSLAILYQEQGKYAEAEPLFQRALTIRERALGEQHLYTAETLHAFAALRVAQNNLSAAVAFYQRELAIREHTSGLQHSQTRAAREQLDAVKVMLEEKKGITKQNGIL